MNNYKESEFYFKSGVIIDQSKFTKLDWEKWRRDKALLDYRYCEYGLEKEFSDEEYQIYLGLWERFCKLDNALRNRLTTTQKTIEAVRQTIKKMNL